MAQLQLGLDAYSPREISEKIQSVGVSKARLSFLQTAMLGVLAGAFIGLGALYYTLVASDSTLGFAATRVLGGLVFSLGLILVSVGGAELFTGNNLMVMAWADGKITVVELLRNWSVVYVANAAGAVGLAATVYLANHGAMNGGAVAAAYVKIAAAKSALPFGEAFFKGVLCNVLVCLAVWLAMAGHTVVDKIVAIVFPVSAFVAAGRQHVLHPARHDARRRRDVARDGQSRDSQLDGLGAQSGGGDARKHRRRRRNGGTGLLPGLPAARAAGAEGSNGAHAIDGRALGRTQARAMR